LRIYADSSFLVSLLYPGDVQHGRCRAIFAQYQSDDWITSPWSLFETVNSLRQLCLKSNGPKPVVIEAIRRQLKHWHTRGVFQTEMPDLQEGVIECQQLSAACGTQLKMRSADVLHVALLEQLAPDLFLTRDKEQHALALNRAFPSRLIP
jgi:predicted nucleic acid-binding protein